MEESVPVPWERQFLGTVPLVELVPDAPDFGTILQDVELPDLTQPLHHLYYSPTGAP